MRSLAIFFLLVGFLYAEKAVITADRFYADQKEHYSVFGGNVNIKKSQDELNATKVLISFDKNNKPLQYKADGNVSFYVKTDDNAIYIGNCESLIYSTMTKEYYFIKNVNIFEEVSNRRLKGEKIILNTQSGTAKVEGEQKKPIRITLDVNSGTNKERKGLNVSDANISDQNETKK